MRVSLTNRLAGPLAFLTALLMAAGLYWPVQRGFFILDDFVWLECAARAASDPAVLFNRSISHFFRPLAHLHFALVTGIFGPSPAALHWASWLLHALCAALLARLILRLTGRAGTALLGAAVFALLPAYGEVMVWVSAVTEPIYVAALLACLGAWYDAVTRRRRWIRSYLLAYLFFFLALASKEAAVSTLPLMMLLHLGLRILGRTVPRGVILYLPFALLLAAYLHFQAGAQQASYLVRGGMYAPGIHFLRLTWTSLRYLLSDVWIPVTILMAGLLSAIPERPRLQAARFGRVAAMGGLLLLAFFVAMLPYALFTGQVLASRYFYLPSVVLAVAIALLAGPSLGRAAGARRLAPALALAAILAIGYYGSRTEVARYAIAADATQRFITEARVLPTGQEAVLVVDSLLKGQQLEAAMTLFHTPGHKITSASRDELPRRWSDNSVWAWDRVTLKFHVVPSPR